MDRIVGVSMHSVLEKEMEEAQEIPRDHDQDRFRPSTSPADMDPDEPLAIGDETTGALRDEPELVQGTQFGFPSRFYHRFLSGLTWARRLIEERFAWPVRAVLLGEGSLRAASSLIFLEKE